MSAVAARPPQRELLLAVSASAVVMAGRQPAWFDLRRVLTRVPPASLPPPCSASRPATESITKTKAALELLKSVGALADVEKAKVGRRPRQDPLACAYRAVSGV